MEQYAKIQQILKKEEGQKERKPIYPPTVIQAVFDAKTGASLEAILAQFNSIYVQYQGTPQATRCIIPKEMRRAGLTITYMNMDSETITERAASAVQKDNDHWGLDINWSRVDELSLSGDISVSAQGTWIINGEDTGIKALGPKGDAGLTPWLKTIDNRLHFTYDNVNWEPCSEPIAAYFRFIATSGNTQSGTIGKIQISRDNKTWNDLSPEFTNNLHIAGYVATTSALPANKPVGTIYGVGPTYATEDTAHTNPIYRIYVYNGTTWVDNGQFTSIAAGIVQETGDSETEVMSQKATTEKLTELASQVIYDVSANNDGVTFASLSALLSSENLSTLIPTEIRCGGMSIRFVQSSDNKYVQYRLMSNSFSTDESNWQGVDNEPTAGSNNLVESDSLSVYDYWIAGKELFVIKGKARVATDGSIEGGHSYYYTTPIIPLSYFRNYSTEGIIIKSGNFRCNSLIYPTILFFDVNRTILSVIINDTRYSSVTNIASDVIPSEAYYIAFNASDKQGVVLFENFGAINVEEEVTLHSSQIATLQSSVASNLESTLANSVLHLSDVNIFSITGFYRDDDNTLVSKGSFNTTPLIPLEYIYNWSTGGIKVESGTFRASPSTSRSLALFFNSNKEVIGTDKSTSTISSVTAFDTTNVPQNTKYIAFNQYNNSNAVILDDFGMKEVWNIYDNIDAVRSELITDMSELSYLQVENYCTGSFTDKWIKYQGESTKEKVGDEVIFSYIGGTNSVYTTLINVFQENHIVYVGEWMQSTIRDGLFISSNSLECSVNNSGNGQYEWLSGCIKITKNSSNETVMGLNFIRSSSSSYGSRTVKIKYPVIIDLTATFGEGNEPNALEMDKMLLVFGERWFVGRQNLIDTASQPKAQLIRNSNELKAQLGNVLVSETIVVNPSMNRQQFISAYNAYLSTFSSLCGCRETCMDNLYVNLTDEENISRINHNFRDDVVSLDMTYETFCNRINNAFQKKIYRFADAKLNYGAPRDFSINPNIKDEEPSFIVSEDCETLYLYGNNNRYSSTDGVNWDEGTSLVQTGYPSGIVLHSHYNVIDGVYYHLFTVKYNSVYQDLYLATSSDGITFTYAGIVYEKGHIIDAERTVKEFGNTFIMREPGGNKYYLYYEFQAVSTGYFFPWEISLATCTNLFTQNLNGTIGNWEDIDSNPILTYMPSRRFGSGCGNPDIARGSDNRPIRIDGKFYMYYHGTYNSTGHLYRAYSYDLVNWVKEGEILDNRDIPSEDNQSANTDHSIIQFKGRTYMVYNKDINLGSTHPAHFHIMIDDRPYYELLKLRP